LFLSFSLSFDYNNLIVKTLNKSFQDGSISLDLIRSMIRHIPDEILRRIENREYSYYNFMPQPVTTFYPISKAALTYSTPCFKSNTVNNILISQNTITFDLVISQPLTTETCMDFYLFGTLETAQFHHLGEGSHNITWPIGTLDSALQWDLNTNGIRIFRFAEDPDTTFWSLAQTVLLFEPEIIGPETGYEFAKMNVEFIRSYANFSFPERPGAPQINLNASQIQSGDFVGVTRMDGLDPMIIWGMGGTTGHTTVALWFPDGLYICESQVNSTYWPTNHIQRTPFDTWVQLARKADYNFVHVPLNAQASAMFNETAAQNLFYELEGTPYGYHNFLFGWVDTPNDNFPCVAPDYTNCLTLPAVYVVAGLVDRISKPIADEMYNQALTHRVNQPWGTFNTTAQIVQYAYETLNLDFGELISLPEQDSWDYTDGKSMVCDVFVCSIWKAAGLFGDLADEIQCTELTPRDVYSMNFFDTNPANRPDVCKKTDPKLPYCQLGGKYELQLPGYGTIQPYANMEENCPGIPPKYNRPSNC
jgi:hypothetical protein